MTKYLQERFSVNYGGSEQYRNNWDAIFGKKEPAESDIRKQVREFHEAFGLPVVSTPTVPPGARAKLRLRLIAEEFIELLEAHSIYTDIVWNHINSLINSVDDNTPIDLVKVADALADLDYVIEGTRLEYGINGKPIADEVHRSNLSKLVDGKPVYRSDGKVQKPDTYSPADVKGELEKQGWKG